MSASYSDELALALRTVHTASLLTKSVLRSLKNHVSAETKADDSPVTVADFAAQAIIISAIHAVYPSDRFIGEESADVLRKNDGLAERVWDLVQQAKEMVSTLQPQFSGVQHVQQRSNISLSLPATKGDMLHSIDLGTSTTTDQGRVWVLDPVDGTATFMDGKQYAVCLCLLVDGAQQVGVIGCPNLAFDAHVPFGQTKIHEDQVDEAGYGVVLSAVKGHGTHIRNMYASTLGEARQVQLQNLPAKKMSELDFVESTLGKTSLSQIEHRDVAETLGTEWPGTVVWSQQIKYVALALGATNVMVRIPKTVSRYTYVWDHAGGHLIFQEAGVIVKDLNGGNIDFGQGRQLKGERNFGMVAAMPWAFKQVNDAVNEVLAKRAR